MATLTTAEEVKLTTLEYRYISQTIWDNFIDDVYNSIAGSFKIKGNIDASANPNYPASDKGDFYRITVAGKIGGASGFRVSVGDIIISWVASLGGTQAAVGSDWNIKQVGLQRVFEVNFSTGDLVQDVIRDKATAIGRNETYALVGNYSGTVGGTYSMVATGTWAVSGTNFQVAANGNVIAGLANGTMTIGRGAGFVPGVVGNTFVGCFTGTDITTGANNTGVGTNALNNATTGGTNTAIGNLAMGIGIVTGDNNVGVGNEALMSCTIGRLNTVVGYQAFSNSTTSQYSTIVGANAFYLHTGGDDNTGLGRQVGYYNTTGINNTYIGSYAGQGNANYVASGGVYLGYFAGYYEGSNNNKFFVDNQDRTSQALGRSLSLMYGIFGATTALQFLTVNAHLLISEDIQFTTKIIDITSGDSATIDSPAGRFRKDNSGTTFTLTNSYITANSVVQLTPANANIDATAVTWTKLCGAGSMVVTFNLAPTADFDMDFLVIN
ncbi:MAG: hypothetical protein V4721_16550 [Bacteroidota bacterium]